MKDYPLKQSLMIVAAGGGLLLIGIYLFSPFFAGTARSKAETTQLEEVELAKALIHYATVFQQFPTNDNAGVVKALSGVNPQQLTFLNLGESSTNKDGQLIDVWSTPYKFTFDSTNRFVITSAGDDRTFGNTDDVVFDSSRNALPKP